MAKEISGDRVEHDSAQTELDESGSIIWDPVHAAAVPVRVD